MKKKGNINSRMADERAEGEEQIRTDVSAEKFQNDQQVVKPVEQSSETKTPGTQFNASKIETKGSQLKQEAVAKVITGVGGETTPAAVALSGSGLRSLAYSGTEGTILGSASGTPIVDSPSRSNTRPGQKMDAVVKAIDFAASEQVLQKFDGSKPLQEDPEAVQGYLGHPENDNARSQKIAEGVPGALLFQRSADEIANDQIVHVAGQVIRERGVDYHYEPTTYRDENDVQKPFTIKRGNYIPKALRIGVRTTDQKLVSMTYDVDDVTPDEVDANTANEAATHFLRDMNLAEINRQNMESVAGVETKDNWCPIVRGIDHPTPTVGFLTDDEITTGSEDYLAYRFFNKAWGYLLNKVGKDGQTPYRTFKEMLFGYARSYNDAQQITDGETPFNAVDYLNGAPSLMIALYDSINKYSKRGDLFTQPRGWKMHKQTADNNINQFRLKPGMASYVSAIDTFSTIDRGYDPLLPTCITDGFRASYPYSFNDLFRRTGGTLYITAMAGKGIATAGSKWDKFVDDNYDVLTGTCHSYTAGVIKGYDSTQSTFLAGSIYDVKYGGSLDDSRRAKKTYTCIVAPDMSTKSDCSTGFDSAADGLQAALDVINARRNEFDHFDEAMIVMFRVEDETADDVYAAIFAPNIYANGNVGCYVAADSVTDALASDMSDADNTAYDAEIMHKPVFGYHYVNRMNPYYVQVKNPLLYGVEEWVLNMLGKLVSPAVSHGGPSVASASNAAANDNIIWYYIPVAHYSRQMSLWDMIVCASVPFQQKIRTNSQMDTLNYQKLNGSYPFAQLKDIGSLNPLASVNYTNNGVERPLGCGVMKPSVALRWVIPEKFWRVRHADTTDMVTDESFVLPFYFAEEQFKYVKGDGVISILRDPDGHIMNYPTVRAGGRWAYTDQLFGMKERDVRLVLDRLVNIPGGDQVEVGNTKAGVYKYSLSNSGVPVVNYTASTGMLTAEKLLKAPREIGWGMTAPLGYVTPASNEYLEDGSGAHTYHVTGDRNTYSIHRYISMGSSFRIRTWRCDNGKDYGGINDPAQVVINRAGNFVQTWREQCDAIYRPYGSSAGTLNYGSGIKFYPQPDIGIAINAADCASVASGAIIGKDGDSAFYPFTAGGLTKDVEIAKIFSLQKFMWTKIQQLPFALSPFDQTPSSEVISDTVTVVDPTMDPYDLMYIFGFCGYKGSDYREDVYNRIYAKQTLGWLFKDDPFESASPIMKDGGFSATV